MSTASTSNIVVSEDTPLEQEETRKASRMTLKEVQNVVGTWKENLHPGKTFSHAPGKDLLVSSAKQPSEPKRSKMVEQLTKATQTTFEDEQNLVAEKPNSGYWEKVAEKRRLALKETVEENARLHMELSEKTDEVNELQSVVESLKSLVETVVEMLNEETEAKANSDTTQVDDSGIAHSLVDDEACN
ncbi:geminin [Anopheles marshallii]|uniref:geminin n=1 Tax=Anopheles marshallii TaxID=1521116 RepID=UPI00237B2C89|nr:geminin [Anopheles marshallii]